MIDVEMNNSINKKVTVSNAQGIHLRPAYLIAELAGKYQSDVSLEKSGEKSGEKADAKSVLEIIGLAASSGTELNVLAAGPDADEAVTAIIHLLDQGFPEEKAAGAEKQ